MATDNEFLLEDDDDEKTIEFIKNYLPQELKEKFTDDDLYYIFDLIVEYYTNSGCLDAQPDEEGYINIDQDEIVNYIIKESAEDGMGPYEPDDVFFVVQGEMEYGNSRRNGIRKPIGWCRIKNSSYKKCFKVFSCITVRDSVL